MSKKTNKPKAVSTNAQPKEIKTEKINVSRSNKQSLIYLGPTIPNVVRHSSVFSNGILPAALEKAVSETRALCRLIVPITDASALVKELNSKGSATANIYKVVAAKYNL